MDELPQAECVLAFVSHHLQLTKYDAEIYPHKYEGPSVMEKLPTRHWEEFVEVVSSAKRSIPYCIGSGL